MVQTDRTPSPLVEKRTFLHSQPKMLLLPRSTSNVSSILQTRNIAVSFRISVFFIREDEYTTSTAHVDSINWLKDPDLFYHELSKEVRSNTSQSESTHKDPLRDRDTVIAVLSTR